MPTSTGTPGTCPIQGLLTNPGTEGLTVGDVECRGDQRGAVVFHMCAGVWRRHAGRVSVLHWQCDAQSGGIEGGSELEGGREEVIEGGRELGGGRERGIEGGSGDCVSGGMLLSGGGDGR